MSFQQLQIPNWPLVHTLIVAELYVDEWRTVGMF